MTALKTVLTGLASFVVGFFTWYGLYFLLRVSMPERLSGGEEAAFKVGYFAVALAGVAVAVGLSSFVASRWRASTLWTVLLVLLLIGLVTYPMALSTSFANDCAFNLEWPIHNDFCD